MIGQLEMYTEIAPVFMSLGNHDYVLLPSDYHKLCDIGIRVLDKEYVELKSGVFIGGLTSAFVLR